MNTKLANHNKKNLYNYDNRKTLHHKSSQKITHHYSASTVLPDIHVRLKCLYLFVIALIESNRRALHFLQVKVVLQVHTSQVQVGFSPEKAHFLLRNV